MFSRPHHHFRYQAFTELAVSLVAILAVFSGMLLIMSVSTDSVENLIKARCNADSKAEKRSRGNDGEYIQTWREEEVTVNMASGQEKTPFTVMQQVRGTSGNPDIYMGELEAQTAAGMAKKNLTDSSFLPDIPEENRIDPFTGADFFLRAANLVEGTASTSNPENLFDGEVGKLNYSFLFPVKFDTLKDSVYMPAIQKEN